MILLTRLAAIFALAMAASVASGQESAVPDGATEEAADAVADPMDIPNNTAFGDWILTCEAATVRRTVCRLVQEQSLRETGEIIARFIAAPVADGAILLAQVPMGVYLPGGAVYRFAENEALEQREMIWQTCTQGLCEAAAPLDEEELALFAEEEALLFGFRPAADAEPVILRVDISRFGEAMDMLRDVDG